jgi:hypothetical protein
LYDNQVEDATGGSTRSRRVAIADILLPIAIVFVVIALTHTHATHLGEFGLPAELPLLYYVGAALLVVSSCWQLSQPLISKVRLSAHLGAFVALLFGTAPLVFREPLYFYLYKYVGVVQYVTRYGSLNSHIDIYQNWPGFFALMAWFDRLVGVQSPIAFAKWSQLTVELLICIILYSAFQCLELSEREVWLALFLYVCTAWVGQDYFAAQALGVVLSFAVIALTLKWLPQEGEAPWVARLRSKMIRRTHAWPLNIDLAPGEASTVRRDLGAIVIITALFAVLVFVHELSPYILLCQVIALAVFGKIRHPWIVLVFLVITLGYLAPRFSFVNEHYYLLASLGHVFGNIQPPSARLNVEATVGARVAAYTSLALSAAIGALALIGLWRRSRRGGAVLVLFLLAASPAVVLLVESYGNEAILRAFLFALPWAACLAASGLMRRPNPRSLWQMRLLVFAVIITLVGLFYPAFFGDDALNYMPTTVVDGMIGFYRSVEPGTVVAVDQDFPDSMTAEYNRFPEDYLYGSGGILEGRKFTAYEGRQLTKIIDSRVRRPQQPIYLIFASTMTSFATTHGLTSPRAIESLESAIQKDSAWLPIYKAPEIAIFEEAPLS